MSSLTFISKHNSLAQFRCKIQEFTFKSRSLALSGRQLGNILVMIGYKFINCFMIIFIL